MNSMIKLSKTVNLCLQRFRTSGHLKHRIRTVMSRYRKHGWVLTDMVSPDGCIHLKFTPDYNQPGI